MVHFSVLIRATYVKHYLSVLGHVELYKHFPLSFFFECDLILRMPLTAFFFCSYEYSIVLMSLMERIVMLHSSLYISQ
jgi:hypothetical protein